MQDIVVFISTYIPSSIMRNGTVYEFQLYLNHPHYDFRFCYNKCYDLHSLPGVIQPSFLYLCENITTQDELLEELELLRLLLLWDDFEYGFLNDDYKSLEGYTYDKHKDWLDTFKEMKND